MGTNTLVTAVDGTIISAADPNQYKTALTADFVPRNTSGVPTDAGGNLGSTLYKWDTLFTDYVRFGTASQFCYITNNESFPRLEFFANNTLAGVIASDGIDGAYLKALSVTDAKINNATITGAKLVNLTVTGIKLATDCIDATKVINQQITREKTSNVEWDTANNTSGSTNSTSAVLVATVTVDRWDNANETDGNSTTKPFIVGICPFKDTTGLSGVTFNSTTHIGVLRITRKIGAGSEETMCNYRMQGSITIPTNISYFDNDFGTGAGTTQTIEYKLYAYVTDAAATISWVNLRFYAYSLK